MEEGKVKRACARALYRRVLVGRCDIMARALCSFVSFYSFFLSACFRARRKNPHGVKLTYFPMLKMKDSQTLPSVEVTNWALILNVILNHNDHNNLMSDLEWRWWEAVNLWYGTCFELRFWVWKFIEPNNWHLLVSTQKICQLRACPLICLFTALMQKKLIHKIIG